MTTPAPTADVLETAGDLLRALAAPVRIAIVLQLLSSPRCVHELVDALSLPQPLVSQHLRILKAAGQKAAFSDRPACADSSAHGW